MTSETDDSDIGQAAASTEETVQDGLHPLRMIVPSLSIQEKENHEQRVTRAIQTDIYG